jgi:hypothetical protein
MIPLLKSAYKDLLKGRGWFLLVAACYFILFFIAQNVNHRFWMHDLEVYYSAAKAFMHGDQVYGLPFGLSSGFYKYSPFALLLFAPLALLPFYAAKVLHFAVLSLLIIVNIILCEKIVSKYFFAEAPAKKLNLKFLIIFIPLLDNIYRELHLGNINTVLLFIFIIALQQLLSGKHLAPGLLLALGILIKPHFIIFLPLLLLRKKFRCLAYTVAGIVAGLLLPALFTGMQNNIGLHRQWLDIMQAHNNSLISGQNTLYSWIYKCAGRFFFSDITRYDKIFGIIILIMISLAFLALIIYHFRKENTKGSLQSVRQSDFVFEYILLLAIIPNITITDTEHFLFSLPLIVYVVHFLFQKGENIIYKIIGIVCLLMYGMNMRDLLGQDISEAINSFGILGLANFLIIVLCIVIHFRRSKLIADKGYNVSE